MSSRISYSKLSDSMIFNGNVKKLVVEYLELDEISLAVMGKVRSLNEGFRCCEGFEPAFHHKLQYRCPSSEITGSRSISKQKSDQT